MNRKLAWSVVCFLFAAIMFYWGASWGVGSVNIATDKDLQLVLEKFQKTGPVLHDLCEMQGARWHCGGILDAIVQEKNDILKKKYENDLCLWGVRYTLWMHDLTTGPELATAQAVDLCWPRRI